MDTFLPLIKAWKQKGITKTHKMLKKKLKVALHLLHSNSFWTKKSLHIFKLDHRWCTTLIQKKTALVGIKWSFSGTHRTSYISKNLNLYPHQSRITFYTLLSKSKNFATGVCTIQSPIGLKDDSNSVHCHCISEGTLISRSSSKYILHTLLQCILD